MGVNTHFYHFSRRLGIFVGHTRGIRGVFVGYTYVSGMCRVCIGYVSGKCRRELGAWGHEWTVDWHGIYTSYSRWSRNLNYLNQKREYLSTIKQFRFNNIDELY